MPPAPGLYTCNKHSHAAIRITVNAAAAGFICKKNFPVQVKKS